jgi:hypothetical protein
MKSARVNRRFFSTKRRGVVLSLSLSLHTLTHWFQLDKTEAGKAFDVHELFEGI